MYRRLTAVCLALLSLSAAAHCVKTGTVCVEAGGTRLVDGIPVTRDCWSEPLLSKINPAMGFRTHTDF